MWWVLRTWCWLLLMTVTVVVVTKMSTGVPAWVRPIPRWFSWLPWQRDMTHASEND
jgi:hypothetical protein